MASSSSAARRTRGEQESQYSFPGWHVSTDGSHPSPEEPSIFQNGTVHIPFGVLQRARHQNPGRFRARRDSEATSNLTARSCGSARLTSTIAWQGRPPSLIHLRVAQAVKAISVPDYNAR